MKILAFPRDSNPYQEELYGAMTKLGYQVRYVGDLTPSHSINVIMLPLEVSWYRLCGYRLFHLHWVYPFAVPLALRWEPMRRIMRWWFGFVLRVLAVLHVPVVWIAHNVLPHNQVFDDDIAARKRLLSTAQAIMAHSEQVFTDLEGIGHPRGRCYLVRHPGFDVAETPPPRAAGDDLKVLFFGNVAEYKGVPDLLRAASICRALTSVTVAGQCEDSLLRAEVESLASERVSLHLERQTENQLAMHLAASDVVVLPFRRVTTSGSALYALSAGRAVVVPSGSALNDLPAEATFRYKPVPDRIAALARVLEDVAEARSELPRMGRAARVWATSYGWADLAEAFVRASRDSVTGR